MKLTLTLMLLFCLAGYHSREVRESTTQLVSALYTEVDHDKGTYRLIGVDAMEVI